jgi:hypothetical protein
MTHPERLAWDGARVLVRAVGFDPVYRWLADEMGTFGTAYREALSDSYVRLFTDRRPDAVHREAGIWRARLLDLLHEQPALAVHVGSLIDRTAQRLEAR